MLKGGGGGTLGADVNLVMDQLERLCLASDGSLISKSSFNSYHLAREEMCKERLRYLEAMAIYSEVMAMVEEHQQTSGIREFPPMYAQLTAKNSSQVFETLEHRLAVAEAAQKLRLPLLSEDGEIDGEYIDKWTTISQLSLDTSTTSLNNNAFGSNDASEPSIGGVPNRFLGITPSYLWKTQMQNTPLTMEMADYQMNLTREIETRLRTKCSTLAAAFVDDIDSNSTMVSTARLPESVKLVIEEIEREEEALREDLFASDRQFAEYYNVLEQILCVLIKLVKELKLQHQHKYDELQKNWLCKRCETMSAKLRVLEHLLLLETYTQESIPALHKIRKYLLEATEEASMAYNKAVTRLEEYQGVDPDFDTIAQQYHDIVKRLQTLQWTIHEVERDFKQLPDHNNT